jgi:hypothetical protein
VALALHARELGMGVTPSVSPKLPSSAARASPNDDLHLLYYFYGKR